MALLPSVCEVLTYALNMCEAGSLNRSTELSSNNVINLLEQTEAEQKTEKRLCLDDVLFLRHRISYIYREPDNAANPCKDHLQISLNRITLLTDYDNYPFVLIALYIVRKAEEFSSWQRSSTASPRWSSLAYSDTIEMLPNGSQQL